MRRRWWWLNGMEAEVEAVFEEVAEELEVEMEEGGAGISIWKA